MFAAYPCPSGTIFHAFVPGKLPIFSFIINKFIISNFVLHNPVHEFTCKWGFLDELSARQTWVSSEDHFVTSISQLGKVIHNLKLYCLIKIVFSHTIQCTNNAPNKVTNCLAFSMPYSVVITSQTRAITVCLIPCRTV